MSWGVLFRGVLYIHSFGTQTGVSKSHFLVKGSLPGATSESKAEVWNVHSESGNLPRKQGDGPRLLEESKGFRSLLAEVPTHQKQGNLSMKKHNNWHGGRHSSDTCIYGFTVIWNKNTQNTFETICCRPCSVPDMVGKFCRNMWTQRQPYSRKSLEGNPKTLSSWRYVSWKLGLWAKFNIHVHFFRK